MDIYYATWVLAKKEGKKIIKVYIPGVVTCNINLKYLERSQIHINRALIAYTKAKKIHQEKKILSQFIINPATEKVKVHEVIFDTYLGRSNTTIEEFIKNNH